MVLDPEMVDGTVEADCELATDFVRKEECLEIDEVLVTVRGELTPTVGGPFHEWDTRTLIFLANWKVSVNVAGVNKSK